MPVSWCHSCQLMTQHSKLSDLSFLVTLRGDINVLLAKQINHLPSRLATTTLDSPDSPESITAEQGSPIRGHGPRQRRSYERPRPNTRLPPSVPLSPVLSQDIPPFVPEIPGSPTSNSTTTQSNTSVSLSDHWAKKVFPDDLSVTRIPSSTER
jgi:hypothetical protein